MTDNERLEELKRILPLHNCDQMGIDMTKKSLAIALIAGPPDNWQTNRLCNLAIAMFEMRTKRGEA